MSGVTGNCGNEWTSQQPIRSFGWACCRAGCQGSCFTYRGSDGAEPHSWHHFYVFEMIPFNSGLSSSRIIVPSSPGCRSPGACRHADGGAEAGRAEAGSVWNAMSDTAGVCGDVCGVSTERTSRSRSLHRGLRRRQKAWKPRSFLSL